MELRCCLFFQQTRSSRGWYDPNGGGLCGEQRSTTNPHIAIGEIAPSFPAHVFSNAEANLLNADAGGADIANTNPAPPNDFRSDASTTSNKPNLLVSATDTPPWDPQWEDDTMTIKQINSASVAAGKGPLLKCIAQQPYLRDMPDTDYW